MGPDRFLCLGMVLWIAIASERNYLRRKGEAFVPRDVLRNILKLLLLPIQNDLCIYVVEQKVKK